MRLVYFGSDEFGVPSLLKLAKSEHQVVSVVTLPHEPLEEHGALLKTPVATQAEKSNLPILGYQDPNHPDLIRKLQALKADVGVVAASNQGFSRALRESFEQGCIGIHPSLLPKYRGPSPIAWCILKGEARTGVTVFRLTGQPDAGPVLIQRQTMIRLKELWLELHYRLARIACDAIDAALTLLMEKPSFEGLPQDESKATWAPMLDEKDGYLSFREPASVIETQCRAMWPFPGTFLRYVGKSGKVQDLRLVNSSAVEGRAKAPPGTITEDFLVATGKGLLEVLALELPNEKLMSWNDFVTEYHVSPGDRFESIGL